MHSFAARRDELLSSSRLPPPPASNSGERNADTAAPVPRDSLLPAPHENVALFASAPSPLMSYEQAFVDSLDDDTSTYRLFKRLCIYFRGQHHLEEIMWRENVERGDLLTTLEKYKSVLVQVAHEALP